MLGDNPLQKKEVSIGGGVREQLVYGVKCAHCSVDAYHFLVLFLLFFFLDGCSFERIHQAQAESSQLGLGNGLCVGVCVWRRTKGQTCMSVG